ncbi:hypothetical protein L6452_21068 [Arctium lappa]|uniref:Uncharacterized protein n=1 Tax=Arctium lappa TaxID=4217 RepID=A0ACB9BD76_ARCLA|nr:hypothetical protein L6452_21068 [Arctium lappa]
MAATTTNNHREAVEDGEGVPSIVAIHSQVKKIKQELEKTNHPAGIEQSEIRSVLREFSKSQKRCRSPLGISDRPISVDLINFNICELRFIGDGRGFLRNFEANSPGN